MPKFPVTKRKRKKRFNTQKFLSTAQKALQVANGVRMLLNVEYKNNDIPETSLSVINSGTLISLNHLSQGDTKSTRTGDSVLNKSLVFKYYITPSPSAVDTYIRLVLIYDKYPNGTMATIDEIFKEARITGHLKIASASRFHVFKEFLISVNASSSENTIAKYYKKFNNHTKYNGTNGGTNGIMSGQMLLYAISNQPLNLPVLSYSTRVRYIDN